ncbi:unnamed protein product, partial [Brassica oleracea]
AGEEEERNGEEDAFGVYKTLGPTDIFRRNSLSIFNFNFPEIFSLIRGKRISCACISINLYFSSEFPRNIPRKYRGTSVWGFKTSICFVVFHFLYNCNAYH